MFYSFGFFFDLDNLPLKNLGSTMLRATSDNMECGMWGVI
jgi:hypothetical protein